MRHVSALSQLMFQSLLNLSSNEGIYASGRDEAYGCVFGRDTALTVLKILNSYQLMQEEELLVISKRALLTLVSLQGKGENIESGEQPGKFIHEFRPRREQYEHLVSGDQPWFLYPDKQLRNFDSLDSTPLALIAIYRYWELTGDNEFLEQCLNAVEAGLEWVFNYGDMDGDNLLEFTVDLRREYGGLSVHSWTDSRESFLKPDGSFPRYPIAPVEVQSYSWLALKLWAGFYEDRHEQLAWKLVNFAQKLKEEFNRQFIVRDENLLFAAQALDGDKNQIKTITANPLLALWAAYKKGEKAESIFEDDVIPDIVKRSFKSDMFVPGAGMRTMSSKSPTFIAGQNSYHNGSFWPILNGMVYEGLLNFGFGDEAMRLKKASLAPIVHFGCPIELYVKENKQYLEYKNEHGQTSCKQQAWSAAAILHMAVS